MNVFAADTSFRQTVDPFDRKEFPETAEQSCMLFMVQREIIFCNGEYNDQGMEQD
jgi:hypothetical protein